jgi:beta-N-acetylhexosaminidase
MVVSDDMAMGAIVSAYSFDVAIEKAINAGIDMLVLSNNGKSYEAQVASKAVAIIYSLVQKGRISEARVNEAYGRVVAVKSRL